MKGLKQKAVMLTFLLLAGICCLGLGGCGQKKHQPGPGEKEYQVYYLNTALTKMVPQSFYSASQDPDQLVSELMDWFLHVPADLDCQTALSDKVIYQGFRRDDMVLYLYFDNNYVGMKSYREILCRAALVKTLTQIPGVDYVSIYSGDQPLMDTNGMPVGMLTAGDFVDDISDVNAYENTELTLYFTDEKGEKLYAEKRNVMHNINTSAEKVVLEELISGPEQYGLYPTLDPSIKVLNVSVNENVCYLNFDATFLNNSLEVRDYIPIYSIVNSLSELTGISRVRIAVNGSQDVIFRDSLSLNTAFERNLDYIGGMDN